jgi:nitroreductase
MLTRREAAVGLAATALAMSVRGTAQAQEAEAAARSLPPPRATGGMPLIDALKLRRSTRAYSTRPLEPQVLSDLLWAADGVNRPSGDRTAPYWRHIMVIDIYAAMADGVWLYDPKAQALLLRQKDDLRALSGTQDFVGAAPLNLIYVAHGERMTDVGPEERRLFASADACFIGQNVYLFCASEGLATVFRGSANQAKLGAAMNLPEGQFVTFAQTVGYPA